MIRTTVLLAVLATPVAAQSTFEGALSMKVTGDKGTSDINYLMKDGKIRMDQAVGKDMGAIVIDPASKKMLMIMNAQKMYMEMEMKTPEAAIRKAGAHPATTERTGRTERIAGFTCEHVLVNDEDGTAMDACVSHELGAFRMPMGGGPMSQPREPGWTSGLAANAFPLKVQKGDKVVFEVTAIERRTLDAALFAAPAGFNKFEMPSMPSFKRPPR